MKKIIKTYMFLALSVVCLANCSSEYVEDPQLPSGLLKSFSLAVEGKEYHANVFEEKKEYSIHGIEYGGYVSAVNFKLEEGAVIAPNPNDLIGKWPQEQLFTVTKGDLSTTYNIVLSDYVSRFPQSGDKVVMGYVSILDPNFDQRFPSIQWKNLTHVLPAFVHVKSSGALDSYKLDSKLAKIKEAADQNGVKILVSIRSDHNGNFEAALQSEQSRDNLAENIVNYTRDNGLAGFDIDYEVYETLQANLQNLLDLFAKLQQKKDADMLMTCAVAGWPAYGNDWHRYFDYINLMSYDYHPKTGGQHSSFEHFTEDVRKWKARGAKASQLVGGLPFYGYSWDPEVPVDNVKAIPYRNIVEHFKGTYPDVADLDVINNTYYNGRGLLRQKCEYAIEYQMGGVMIWQLFQDSTDKQYRLIDVVGEVMFSEKKNK